jgi:hypothetical protein
MKKLVLFIVFIVICGSSFSRDFVHPGGLHTLADLERMKEKVAAAEQPYIDAWNVLIQDALAQSSYTATPRANIGDSRQGASKDAHAAYLNAIRWYVSGDEAYAECAIRILNAWSSTVNQVPSGNEVVGLGGISFAEFAMAAEIMRLSDKWQATDFNRFKDMAVNYLYPNCHDFLTNHNGRCIQYYWANWDACNIMALIAIGVLCDNEDIYNEGVEYFKNGGGSGSIINAVPFVHENGTLGQWQEAGRDQTHGFLGVGFLATACQIAKNQGDDLFGYDNNRLLAGAEYVAKYNLGEDVPFTTYDNCQDLNHDWPATNGRGVFHDRPVYEMVYNHYVGEKGLTAPYTTKMASIIRPEKGSLDHFGYGTLTFTLDASASPINTVVPPAPATITATAGTGRVMIEWTPSADLTMRGYELQRATAVEGPYTTLASTDLKTTTTYTDTGVTNGTTYYYRVAGFNQAGTGEYSAASGAATPLETGELPVIWNKTEIGDHTVGDATYANVSGGTFVVNGYGTGISGTADNVTFLYRQATGDDIITVRINNVSTLSNTKVGLMVRESLDANAKTVSMTLGEGGGRFARMGYRTATGGSMADFLGNTYTWTPAWFRIARSGNTFTAFESSNGTEWFEVGHVDIEMADSYYSGLVVTSTGATAVNKATFDYLTFTGSEVIPPYAQDTLMVKFRNSAAPGVEGWQPIVLTDKNIDDVPTTTIEAFEGSVVVEPVFLNTPIANSVRSIYRSSNLSFYTGENRNLLASWIAADVMQDTDCDAIGIQITGLPAGKYAFTSYHHDLDNQCGSIVPSLLINGETVATGDTTIISHSAAWARVTADAPTVETARTAEEVAAMQASQVTDDFSKVSTIIFDSIVSTSPSDTILVQFQSSRGHSTDGTTVLQTEKLILVNGFTLIENNSVAFEIKSEEGAPIEGASVEFVSRTKLSDENGKVVFADLGSTTDLAYTVTAKGYEDFTGTIALVAGDMKIPVALALSVSSFSDNFKVNFKPASAPNVDGWESINVTDKALYNTTTPIYALGTSVKVTPVWLNSPVANNVRSITRTSSEYSGDNKDILRSWIAVDVQYNNDCDVMGIQITDLPAGQYSFESFHHDFHNGSGILTPSVSVNGVTTATGDDLMISHSQGWDAVLAVDASAVDLPQEEIDWINERQVTSDFSKVSKTDLNFASTGTADTILVKFTSKKGHSSTALHSQKLILVNGFIVTKISDNPPTSIGAEISDPKISVYPTISKDGLFTLNTENIANVSVYNLSGQLVKQLPAAVSGKTTFTLTESQMYIVKVVDINGGYKVFKIIKQ